MIELKVNDPMANFKDALRSQSAKRQYPVRLKYFFDSLYTEEDKDFIVLDIPIEEQIKEFMNHKKDEEWIENCFRKMLRVQKRRVEKGEIEESTIYNYYKAAKVFCDQNRIRITWKIITKIIPTGKKHADDRIPTDEEIQKLVAYEDRRMKPIVYTMLSSGMRIEGWNYLKWKHIIPLYDDNDKVLAAKIIIYAGDKEEYYSFISPEAYNYLKDYIDYRKTHGEKITPDSWVIRDKFQSTIKNGVNVGDIDRPKQLRSGGIKSLLERAAISQNIFRALSEGEKRREWALAHGLRKYFKTKTEQVMKSINIEMLMGHYIGVSTSYYKPTEKEILGDYLKAVELLTFDQANKNIDKIRAEITSEVYDKLKREILVMKYDKVIDGELNKIYEKYYKFRIKTKERVTAKEKFEIFSKSSEAKRLEQEQLNFIKNYAMTEDGDTLIDYDELDKSIEQIELEQKFEKLPLNRDEIDNMTSYYEDDKRNMIVGFKDRPNKIFKNVKQ